MRTSSQSSRYSTSSIVGSASARPASRNAANCSGPSTEVSTKRFFVRSRLRVATV